MSLQVRLPGCSAIAIIGGTNETYIAVPVAHDRSAPSAAPTIATPCGMRESTVRASAYRSPAFSGIRAKLAPFYAKEKGIFLQNGLEVDLSLIDGGGRSMAALLGNSVDIAQLGGTETMSAYVGGGDVEAVALFVPVSPWVLMAPASYTGPNDLKGKTVGVASKGARSRVAGAQEIEGFARTTTKSTSPATGSVAN